MGQGETMGTVTLSEITAFPKWLWGQLSIMEISLRIPSHRPFRVVTTVNNEAGERQMRAVGSLWFQPLSLSSGLPQGSPWPPTSRPSLSLPP